MHDNLVKRLRADADYMDSNGIMLYAAAPFYRKCADAIEELSREYESIAKSLNESVELVRKLQSSHWIPVTERLPEGDNRILVCSKLRDGQYWQSVCRFANNLHEVDEYDFPNERRPGFYYYDDEYGWIEKTGVTHWMPRPEPPKEET